MSFQCHQIAVTKAVQVVPFEPTKVASASAFRTRGVQPIKNPPDCWNLPVALSEVHLGSVVMAIGAEAFPLRFTSQRGLLPRVLRLPVSHDRPADTECQQQQGHCRPQARQRRLPLAPPPSPSHRTDGTSPDRFPLQETLQLVAQFRRRLVTPSRPFLKTLQADRLQISRDRGVQSPRALRLVLDHLSKQHPSGAAKRSVAG